MDFSENPNLTLPLKCLNSENMGLRMMIHDFFSQTRVIFLQETGKTNTDLNLTNPNDDPSIQEQRHRGFGRCYTIHPAEKFRKLGLYYFKIWL